MSAPKIADAAQPVASGPPRRLERALRELFPGASWNQVRRLVETGKVSVDTVRVTDPRAIVREKQVVAVKMSAPRAAREDSEISNAAILYTDRSIVVVNKPAGISTVPFDDERGTLYDRVTASLRRGSAGRGSPLGVVHRLDKETSGVIVFARSLAAKRELKQQFRVHSTGRRYVAIVHGRIASQTISSRLVADRGDGIRGSTSNPRLGVPAVTHVKTLTTALKASLVECRLETGRTHQIRIHLFEAGHSVLGERVYVRRFRAPPSAEPRLEAPRLMLHARTLEFDHPESGERVRYSAELPDDFVRVARELGLAIEPHRR